MRKRIGTLFTFLLCSVSTFAAGPSSPYGVGFEPTADNFELVWFYPGVNTSQHANDMGTPSQYYLVAVPGNVGRVLVEFAGLDPAVAVDNLHVFLWGIDPFPGEPGDSRSPFIVTLFKQIPTTISDSALWGPQVVFAEDVPPSGGWVSFPVHRGFNTNGKIYAEFRWQPSTKTAPLPALSWQPGESKTYRGFSAGDQLVWSLEPKGNLLLRIQQNVSDTVAGYELPADLPDSFALFLDTDSLTCATTANIAMNLTDSLHCELSRASHKGMFVSVAAWLDGLCGNRTDPLYLDPAAPLASPVRIQPDTLFASIKQGETIELTLTLSNLLSRPLLYSVRAAAGGKPKWLDWDSSWTPIESDGYDTLNFVVSGVVVDAGTYCDTLTIRCTADDLVFREQKLIAILEIDQATAVAPEDPALPPSATLMQNYPNPFNATTIIYSNRPAAIQVHNLLGQVVATLLPKGGTAADGYRFEWNGRDQRGAPVASGVYFYRQQGIDLVRRMVLLK